MLQAARNQAEAPGNEPEAPGREAADEPEATSDDADRADSKSSDTSDEVESTTESDSESDLEIELRVVPDLDGFNHEIRSVVGRRKRDDDGHTETTKPKGQCRLIHWGFEGGEDCPVDQCTWESLLQLKAPLDADELLGKAIEIKCSSRWYSAPVESHVVGNTTCYPLW